MVIFHSYVSLPEGNSWCKPNNRSSSIEVYEIGYVHLGWWFIMIVMSRKMITGVGYGIGFVDGSSTVNIV